MRFLIMLLLVGCADRVACSLPVKVAPGPDFIEATKEAIRYWPDGYFEISDDGYSIDFGYTENSLGLCTQQYHIDTGCVYKAHIDMSIVSPVVVAHEIGHLLGLHDMYSWEDRDCLMYYEVKENQTPCQGTLDKLDETYEHLRPSTNRSSND